MRAITPLIAPISLALAAVAGCAREPSEASLTEADTQYCPTPVVEGVDVYSGNGFDRLDDDGRVGPPVRVHQGQPG